MEFVSNRVFAEFQRSNYVFRSELGLEKTRLDERTARGRSFRRPKMVSSGDYASVSCRHGGGKCTDWLWA